MLESTLMVIAKMIKAEYLFGVFSCIAVAMSYFVVTEAQQVVNDHKNHRG